MGVIWPMWDFVMLFLDGSSEVELRVKLESALAIGAKDIVLDAGETTLTIKVQRYGLLTTVVEIKQLFDRIRPTETIWYIDDNELVVSLKKQDGELKWPDILESWECLQPYTVAGQLLKGTSVYLVGESTGINHIVARELSPGLGYAPITTKDLLETISNQTIHSWIAAEGSESVDEAGAQQCVCQMGGCPLSSSSSFHSAKKSLYTRLRLAEHLACWSRHIS